MYIGDTRHGFALQAGVVRGDHGELWLEPVAAFKGTRGSGDNDDDNDNDDDDDDKTFITFERSRRRRRNTTGANVDTGAVYGYTQNKTILTSGGRPHLVFRRSAAVAVEIGAGRKRRRKKKKKHERNCGTRGKFANVSALSLSSLANVDVETYRLTCGSFQFVTITFRSSDNI